MSDHQPTPTVDLGYPTEPHGRIPAFHNIEEEAAFWDTHDVTDYLDESAPATITVGPALAAHVTVRLNQTEREALAKRAKERGVAPSTLVHTWLNERLQQEEATEAAR